MGARTGTQSTVTRAIHAPPWAMPYRPGPNGGSRDEGLDTNGVWRPHVATALQGVHARDLAELTAAMADVTPSTKKSICVRSSVPPSRLCRMTSTARMQGVGKVGCRERIARADTTIDYG